MAFEAGSVVADLKLDRTPFMNSLRAARQAAWDFARDRFEATLGAATQEFDRNVGGARRAGFDFARKRYEATLSATTAEVGAGVGRAGAMARAWSRTRAEAVLGVDLSLVVPGFAAARREAEQWARENPEAAAGVDISEVAAKIATARRLVRTFGATTATATVEVKVKQEIDRERRRIEALRAAARSASSQEIRLEAEAQTRAAGIRLEQLRALARSVGLTDVEIDADVNAAPALTAFGLIRNAAGAGRTAVNNFNRSMYTIRNVGAVAARAGIFSVIGALGPLTSGAAVAASALGGLGAGFGLIAAAAVPSISALANHETAAKALASAEETEREAKNALTDAQRALNEARRRGDPRAVAAAERAVTEASRELALAQDGVARASRASGAVLTATQEILLAKFRQTREVAASSFRGAMAASDRLSVRVLDLAQRVLPFLGRESERNVGALSRAFDDLSRSGREPRQLALFRRFFDRVPGMVESGTTAVGNFGMGLLNVLSAAAPYAARFLGWVEKMSARFLGFTRSVGGQNAIKKFFDDTLPVVGKLAGAFGKVAAGIFKLSTSPETISFFGHLADAIGFVGEQIPKLRPVFGILNRVASAFGSLPKPVREAVVQAGLFYAAFSLLGGGFLVGIGKGLFTFVRGLAKLRGGGKIATSLSNAFKGLPGAVGRAVSGAGQAVGRLPGLVGRAAAGVGRGISAAGRTFGRLAGFAGRAATATGRALGRLPGLVSRAGSGVGRAVSGVGRFFGKLPGLAAQAATAAGRGFGRVVGLVSRTAGGVGRGVAAVGRTFGRVVGVAGRAATGAGRAFGRIVGFFSRVVSPVGRAVSRIGAAVARIVRPVASAASRAGSAFGKVVGFFGRVVRPVAGVIGKVISTVARIAGPVARVVGKVGGVFLRFLGGSGVVPLLLRGFLGTVAKVFLGPVGVAITVAQVVGLIVKHWSGISGFLRKIPGWFASMGRAVVNTVRRIPAALAGVGAAIVQGLIDGVKNKFSAVQKVFQWLASNIPGWVKNVLGISSPSRVMMSLGASTGEGFARGIEGKAARIRSAAETMAREAAAAASGAYAPELGFPKVRAPREPRPAEIPSRPLSPSALRGHRRGTGSGGGSARGREGVPGSGAANGSASGSLDRLVASNEQIRALMETLIDATGEVGPSVRESFQSELRTGRGTRRSMLSGMGREQRRYLWVRGAL